MTVTEQFDVWGYMLICFLVDSATRRRFPLLSWQRPTVHCLVITANPGICVLTLTSLTPHALS